MSSRALRKLERSQKEEVGNELENDSDEPNSLLDHSIGNGPGFSFAMLAALEDNDNAAGNAEEDQADGESGFATNNSVISEKGRKGKRKKKKKKGGVAEKKEEEMPGIEPWNEVEKAVSEVNSLLGELPSVPESSSVAGSSRTSAWKDPLAIDARFLNPETELKKKFGANVVGSSSESRSHRRIRKYFLVSPLPSWPPPGRQGLSMVMQESSEEGHWFVFEHSQAYREAQYKFWEAVDSYNPDALFALLRLEPYHLDTLLQASEVFRMAEDYESCREMVHRALFACESAFHPRFSLTAGTSRLNYKYAVNRPFFLALFRHAMFLGQRACYRTALEVTKVTLSFDLASDPLALTLLLDHFALRADEDKWLVDFIDTFEPQRNLTLLPNMAFSRALALFKCGQKDEADRALETALRRFPGVLIPLIEACGASPVTAVSEHPDFCLASRAKEPKSLQALQDLYISRTSPGWKVPGVMAWLEQVVERLCQDKTPSRTVEEIESFHKRFLYMPRNVKRHLVLCDASISAALIGNQESQIHSYDPLPPPDSIAPYDRPSRRRATDSDSFVSGLLRSLLPGFNPNEVQERLQEAEARRGVVAEAQVVLERLREMILQFGQETAAQEPHLPDELD